MSAKRSEVATMKQIDDGVWRGDTMDIHSPAGTQVTYHGTFDEAVRWGNCDDPRKVLKIGKKYTVASTEVHSWHTKVCLVGVEGLFPAGAFHTKGQRNTKPKPVTVESRHE